jgi:hypothetical protein
MRNSYCHVVGNGFHCKAVAGPGTSPDPMDRAAARWSRALKADDVRMRTS